MYKNMKWIRKLFTRKRRGEAIDSPGAIKAKLPVSVSPAVIHAKDLLSISEYEIERKIIP